MAEINMNDDIRDDNRKDRRLWWLVGIIGFVILLIVVFNYIPSNNDELITAEPFQGTSPQFTDEEVNSNFGNLAADILDNPDRYIGSQVTVRSETDNWISDRAFTIDADGIIGDRLLVITDSDDMTFTEDEAMENNDVWEITGIVNRLDFQNLDPDIDQNMLTDYEDMPYIQATGISKIAQ